MTANLRDLSTAFSTKQRPVFSSSVKPSKGPRLLVVNNVDIPCTETAYGDKKKIYVTFAVVKCLDVGYTSTPLTNKQGGGDKPGMTWETASDAKPLSQRSISDPEIFECFPFEIEPSPMNKGPRVEAAMFTLQPGMSFGTLFWRDPPIYQKSGGGIGLPVGCSVISAFSNLVINTSIKVCLCVSEGL